MWLFESGDQVLARDEETGDMAYKHILDAYSHHHDDGMRLTVIAPSGEVETITTTQEHPFYVNGLGFVPASELLAGQMLVNTDGQLVGIYEVDLAPILLEAYNYTVEDYQTYFVGSTGLWVHNACDIEGLDRLLESASRPSRVDSGDSRALQSLKKKIDRGDPAFRGIDKSDDAARTIIRQIMRSENQVTRTRTTDGNQISDIFDRDTGRGVRIKNGEFDTFVNL